MTAMKDLSALGVRLRTACLVAVATVPASPVLAQEATGWTFAISPYAYLPALSSSVGTEFGSVSADSSTSDILSDLDMAFMGAFEARNGRWSLILDLLYADLAADQATPLGLFFSKARVETQLSMFTTYAGYRVYETDRAAIDLLGGGRFFWLDVDLKLEPGILEGRSESLDDNWADVVVGVRGRFDLTDSWFATGLADFGGMGGGSSESWQIFGSIGYQFDPRWSAQAGWRYVSIEQRIDGQNVELDLNGPILGFTYRF